MATRIFMVRHGSTMLSTEDRFAGETDVLLSDQGREQLHQLAHRLENEKIEAFYASPMKRTIESAQILATPHRKEIIPRDGLKEISHGRWEQLTREEVELKFPEEYDRWEQDPFTFAPLGGETGLQVTARALPVLLDIVEKHKDKCALIVSHKATIRLLLSSLLGFDPRSYRDRLDQSPACLNVLDFKDVTRARLILFNDVSHYAASSSSTPGLSHHRLSSWWDHPLPSK